MLGDARTGETIAEIPGASVEGLSSEHDNGEGANDSFTGYGLDIPEPVDGHYEISVNADSGLSLNVAAYSKSGVIAAESVVDTMIVDGKLDELPEQAFYMRGPIEEAIEAGEKMLATA